MTSAIFGAIFGDVRARAARRLAIASAVAVLALPIPAIAQGARPPITIPPAQIIPPTTAGESAPAEPTMRALLPGSVQILHDPQGTGIVMYGALTAKAASALAVALGVFTYSQAFDPIPALPLVLADEADRHAQALFTATVGGMPVVGITVVSLSDKGGDVSVFYDYADSFAASFARMRQAFGESGGTGTIALSPFHLGDGKEIGIPSGWRIIGQGAGLVDVMGTQGEFVSLGVATPVHARSTAPASNLLQGPCCDPVKALQAIYPQLSANAQHMGSPAQLLSEIVEAQPTPAPTGGQAAFILSNLTVGGRPYSYLALVTATAGFTDPWTFTLSGVTAPQPIFIEEFPTLLRIWRSYSGASPDFADRLRQALPSLATTQRLLQSTTRPRETAEYNAGDGWDEAIRAAAAAGQAATDDATAQKLLGKLSADTGRPWRIVAASELK